MIKAQVVMVLAVVFALAGVGRSQTQPKDNSAQPAAALPPGLTPAAAAALEKRVESYLRESYAWGPAFEMKMGAISAAPANLYAIPVQVSLHGRSDTATVYVSHDGNYIFRGDVQDMRIDPLAEVRSKLTLKGYASEGPENAKVVIVEFADFECPSCRELDAILRQVLPKYPQVRLVFKDFPLTGIHPWAMTAAIASHCVLQKSSEAFWKFHNSVYDNQDTITPENAYDELTKFAVAAGADASDLHACMADPATRQIVEKSIQQGKALDIDSTPTSFIDGRRLIGPNQSLLEQYLDYDLHKAQ